ncbi:hypothetical protein [Cryobacterium sp. Y50]|uniref:hypothetical protein n=1 Tax=Cryobacterium sp. Y50 TaxID=2048286 RepID=UPI000CE53392|nr:hypothetical protein [Cryobacterium sp. Y50]
MSSERFLPLALKHLALIASLAAVALAVLRVFFFSGFSVPVGLAVLGVADRTSILASTLLLVAVAFVPAFMGLEQPRAWVLAGNADGASLAVKFRTALIWLPLSLFIMSVAPVLVFAGVLLGTILGHLLSRWLRSAKKQDQAQRRAQAVARRAGWAWATFTGLLLTLVLQQPWTPVERIQLSGSSTDFVGYVVGEQLQFTLLLDQKKRPEWTESEDILRREICIPGSRNWTSMTVVELLKSSAGLRLPTCPSDAP